MNELLAAMEVSLLSFLSPCVAADWDLSDAVTPRGIVYENELI